MSHIDESCIRVRLVSRGEFFTRIEIILDAVRNDWSIIARGGEHSVYGVPRGGMIVAGFLANNDDMRVVLDPVLADFFVDDIIDTGMTRASYADRFPGVPFFGLFNKVDGPDRGEGVIAMPWEQDKVDDAEKRGWRNA